jgi:hypothetical protein
MPLIRFTPFHDLNYYDPLRSSLFVFELFSPKENCPDVEA